MKTTVVDRRTLAWCGSALVAATLPLSAAAFPASMPAADPEITNDNAAIHQRIVFAASPARVYGALTQAAQFDKVVQLSTATNSSMKSALGDTPTMIDARPGGAFALFGGYVSGFNLELRENAEIVQAWRSGGWAPGLYSIARFVLAARGAGTKLSLDHTGFPNAAARHLAEGWHENYWQPLTRVLA